LESLQIEVGNENQAWSDFERGICSDYGNQSQETLCLIPATALAPLVTLGKSVIVPLYIITQCPHCGI